MGIRDRYDLDLLVNQTEEKVLQRIEGLLKERDDICACQDCVLDLVTYTLNRVTPRYRVSLLGALRENKRADRKLEVEIDVALQSGLERIRRHPHHTGPD
jgi:competence protein ComFB